MPSYLLKTNDHWPWSLLYSQLFFYFQTHLAISMNIEYNFVAPLIKPRQSFI